jgi:signal transduction histidine kinase
VDEAAAGTPGPVRRDRRVRPAQRAASRGRPGRFSRLSIRNKLLAMVLLPLAGVLPLLAVILLAWSGEAFDRLLITKIRADLAVAQGYFDRTLAEVGASAGAMAESRALHDALARPAAGLPPLLEAFRRREKLDFVNLREPDGTLRATHAGLPAAREPAPPAFWAAAAQRDLTSVELLAPTALERIGPELLARVPVPLVNTRNAAPTSRKVEERAMLLQSMRAVRDAGGRLLGHVQAGVLLNRNLAFIDHINEIVYPEGSLPFGSHGTATLFLDDVRISTNVRLFAREAAAPGAEAGDERAIGTRVSMAVRENVLGRGQTWLDRAFVVSDWYVSAYLPLADSAGQRIGMLYVGFLERPFTLIKYAALATIALVFASAMALAALVSLRWARSIFRPIEQMEATMQRVGAGALDARVGALASTDELGRLARHLDQLLDAVGEKTHELQRWNAELDAKVAERTRALEQAQAHLVRSEKLATMGQLTASIAHEVNNPIAVIQGNLDLARDLLGPAAAPVAPELRLVDEQIERMRLIVTQLLQFARPTEYAGYVTTLDAGRLLDESLILVEHLLGRAHIEVRSAYAATRAVAINRQELQQVFVNLLVNAVHAMPEGGTLELATRDAGDEVLIEVADTGPGLAPELMGRLFQPFATRKAEGTGLGLWISRGIVERYGGDIRAANRGAADPAEPPRGAIFTVHLRAEAAA